MHERRLLHFRFCSTFCYPQPPPPRIKKPKKYVYNKGKMSPISLLSCLAFGMNDLAAGEYLPDSGGWVGANDENEAYGIASVQLENIMEDLQKTIDKGRADKLRSKLLALDKRNQIQGKLEMEKQLPLKIGENVSNWLN